MMMFTVKLGNMRPRHTAKLYGQAGTVDNRRRSIITLLGKEALVKGLYVMVKVMATLMATLMAKPTPAILADLDRASVFNKGPVAQTKQLPSITPK
jgi:hypothetical protein